MLLWSQEPTLAWHPAIHIPADPAKGINGCVDECTWTPDRAAVLLQLTGKFVCSTRTWSVCLVNHVTFLLQAKNSKVKCVDKPGVRAYLRKLSLSPGAICDIKVYCTDALNKRIHWQGLLEISVRDASPRAGREIFHRMNQIHSEPAVQKWFQAWIMSHWRPGLIQGREWGSHAAGVSLMFFWSDL